MKMIALFISSTKGLGIYFCCIKQIEDKENFIKSVFKTEKLLKYWKIVNVAIEGKFFFLKALAVSKIYIFRY